MRTYILFISSLLVFFNSTAEAKTCIGIQRENDDIVEIEGAFDGAQARKIYSLVNEATAGGVECINNSSSTGDTGTGPVDPFYQCTATTKTDTGISVSCSRFYTEAIPGEMRDERIFCEVGVRARAGTNLSLPFSRALTRKDSARLGFKYPFILRQAFASDDGRLKLRCSQTSAHTFPKCDVRIDGTYDDLGEDGDYENGSCLEQIRGYK